MNKIVNCVCGRKLNLSTQSNLKQKCPSCGFVHEYIEFFEVEDKVSFEVKGKYIGLYNKLKAGRYGKN